MKKLENKSGEIKISTSKKKMLLIGFGSLLFVIAGIFIIYKSYSVNDNSDNTKALILGGSSILFFGLGVIISLKKLISSKAGLIVNSKGITDNSTFTNVGFIPWNDITGFHPIKVVSNDFLIIHVINPKTYISKGKNMVTRQSLKYNYNMYGSPIALNASSLSLKITKVEKILLEASEKYS